MTEFNKKWLFRESADSGEIREEDPSIDDGEWQRVDLPHDWSVDHSFEEKWDGCTGYLPGGIGWYRKHFALPEDAPRDKVYLCFDGVYNNGDFYLNGKRLGTHNYGYSPFYFEISRFLADGENVLAVKVDRTRYADSRWYTGSGIYRDVELLCRPSEHIVPHGIYLTTPEINKESGQVRLEVETAGFHEGLTLLTEIFDPGGLSVAKVENRTSGFLTVQDLTVANPVFWDIDAPRLYKAETTLKKGDMVLQTCETPFGFRTILFDAAKGFFLNGKNRLVKGVCLHHDGGLVGAAVPDEVWERRLLKLREGGCNAVRTAHNPPSRNFLDLCDRLGMLVQNEFYDEWDNPKDKQMNGGQRSSQYMTQSDLEPFKTWAERELKATMKRDRNHPCIFQWSIGNEIEWCYPECRDITGYFDAEASGNYFWTRPPVGREEIARRVRELPSRASDIGETARLLAGWVRDMDTTRPIIANCILPSGSYENGYIDALDIAGFSYRRVLYDYARENYPDKPFMGTENVGQWHEWKAVEERDFVSGIFIWTGIDYMGESHGQWPVKATSSGLLDTAGFDKPSWHLYKTLWTDKPHTKIYTVPLGESLYEEDGQGGLREKEEGGWEHRLWYWNKANAHWNYGEGEKIAVEIYSNQPRLELFQNGLSLGTQELTDWEDHTYKWLVAYETGILEARDEEGKRVALLAAAGDPSGMEITLDKGDCTHVTVQLTDKEGLPVRHWEREIHFELKGEGEILGVDNGASNSVQPFRSNRITTSQGRCLMILRKKGDILRLAVSGNGLDSQEIAL